VTTVFVADGKPVKQIFDRFQADAPQVGRAARTDTLEELQRPLQGRLGS
jgi:hypothetical protein